MLKCLCFDTLPPHRPPPGTHRSSSHHHRVPPPTNRPLAGTHRFCCARSSCIFLGYLCYPLLSSWTILKHLCFCILPQSTAFRNLSTRFGFASMGIGNQSIGLRNAIVWRQQSNKKDGSVPVGSVTIYHGSSVLLYGTGASFVEPVGGNKSLSAKCGRRRSKPSPVRAKKSQEGSYSFLKYFFLIYGTNC